MLEKPTKRSKDDDGRVICNMDVEGMPWHDKIVRAKAYEVRKVRTGEQMTRAEAWSYTWSAVLAGLLIVAVFSVTWVLFILFCTQIWFR